MSFGSGLLDAEAGKVASPGCWLSLPALWTSWAHRGYAAAGYGLEKQCTEVLSLSVGDFRKCLQRHMRLHHLCAEYGSSLCELLSSDLAADDFTVSWEKFSMVIHGMQVDLRRLVSRTSLFPTVVRDLAVQRTLRSLTRADRGRLLGDVESGTCFVVNLGMGVLQRVLPVLAVQVTRSDGRQLVDMTPPCQLPGVSLQPEETPEEARDRLVTLLAPALPGPVTFHGVSRRATRSQSRRYPGFRTEYIMDVHAGTMTMSEPGPAYQPMPSGQTDSTAPSDFLQRIESLRLDVDGVRNFAWLSEAEWAHVQTSAGEQAVAQWARGTGGRLSVQYLRSSLRGY